MARRNTQKLVDTGGIATPEVAVGDNLEPDASAALDVNSTTRGVGFPSMTTTQRDAITAPRDGLVIYNSTTNKLNLRANGAWEVITSA